MPIRSAYRAVSRTRPFTSGLATQAEPTIAKEQAAVENKKTEDTQNTTSIREQNEIRVDEPGEKIGGPFASDEISEQSSAKDGAVGRTERKVVEPLEEDSATQEEKGDGLTMKVTLKTTNFESGTNTTTNTTTATSTTTKCPPAETESTTTTPASPPINPASPPTTRARPPSGCSLQ